MIKILVIGAFGVTMTVLGQGFADTNVQVGALFASEQGTFACAVENLQNGERLLINEHESFHAASTMKTPVMIEVFRQAREGRFSLDDSIQVLNSFRSVVDGSTYALREIDDSDTMVYRAIGTKMSVRTLVEQMITRSSNLATNILIDQVSPDSVTTTMRSLGANEMKVFRGVEDQKAFDRGLNNTTTAWDLLVVMKALAQGTAVDPGASREMVQILGRQEYRDKIPALLPRDVAVAHKTGSITGVQHDGGIVSLPDGRRYVIVLLSKGLRSEEAGIQTLAKASRIVYEAMIGN